MFVSITKLVPDIVSIPVIACGGAGSVEHISEVIVDANADAVAVASVLHYDYLQNNPKFVEMQGEGNQEFLKSGRQTFSRIKTASLPEIKKYLHQQNVKCRW